MRGKKNFSSKNDWILIERFHAPATLGVTEIERAHPQKVSLTIHLKTNLRRAGKTDRLEDTLDYAAVVEGVRHLLSSRTYILIERLAEEVADWIMNTTAVEEVKVQAMKTPFPDVDEVGVLIQRKAKKRAKKTR